MNERCRFPARRSRGSTTTCRRPPTPPLPTTTQSRSAQRELGSPFRDHPGLFHILLKGIPKKTQQLTIHYSFYSVTTLTELHTMTLTCNVRFSTHKEFTPGPGQYDVSAVSTVKKGSIVNSSRYYTTDGNILTVWGVRLLKMFG